MSRLRKNLILCLLIVIVLSVFAACGKKDEVNNSYNDIYDWVYEQEFVDEHDPDMIIDGNLSEARWQGKKWLELEQDGVKLKFTTVMTEYGLYVGGIADDPDLVWNARLNIFAWTANITNSSFSFFIHGKDVTRVGPFETFSFFFDAYNKRSREQTRFAAKATTYDENGNVVDIVKDNPVRMVGEMFVSWDALNIELVDGQIPEYVYVVPYYRHVPADDSSGNARIEPLYGTMQSRFETHPRFSVDGYMTAIDPSSPIGRAGNGYSHTSGWDISRIEEGVVKTTGPHEQVLFYTPLYSEKYVFSVDVKYIEGYPGLNSSCHAGICNMTSYRDLSAMYLYGSQLNNGIAQLQQLYLNNGWRDNTLAKIAVTNYDANNPEKDKINIKVIKDRSNFYYIVNDILAYIHTDYDLEGKACPGVFALSALAEFSNFNGIDYANDEAGLQSEISKYAYKIEYDSQINGGEIAVNKPAISKTLDDKSLEISVVPAKGYVISEFAINGEDKFNYLLNNMVDGVLTLPSVNEDITLTVKFERYTKVLKDNCFNISGKVTDENGSAIASVKVAVYNETNPFVRYSINVTSQGYYSFDLLKPSTEAYRIGEKTYEIGEKYIFEIIPPITYKQTTFTFDCSTLDSDQTKVTKDVKLQSSMLGENRGIIITADVTTEETSKIGLSGTFSMVATTTKDRLGLLVTSGNKSVAYYLAWRGFGYHDLNGKPDDLYFNNASLNQNKGPGKNVYRKYDWKTDWLDDIKNTSIRVYALIENDVLKVYYNDKTDIKGDTGKDEWILTWEIDLTDAKFGFESGSKYKIGVYSNSKNNTAFFLDQVYNENTESELFNCALGKHDYDLSNGVIYPEATCTKYGTITYSCRYCGAKKEEKIAPKGHTWGETDCSVCHTKKITITFKNGNDILSTIYLGSGEKIEFPTDWVDASIKIDGWRLNNVEDIVNSAVCGSSDATYYAVTSENKFEVYFDSDLDVKLDESEVSSGDMVSCGKELSITFNYGYNKQAVIKDNDVVIAIVVGPATLKYPVTADVNLTVELTDFALSYSGTQAGGSAAGSGTLSQDENGYSQMPTGIKWGAGNAYNNGALTAKNGDLTLTIDLSTIKGTTSEIGFKWLDNSAIRLGIRSVKQTETGYSVTLLTYLNTHVATKTINVSDKILVLKYKVSDVDNTMTLYVNGEIDTEISNILSTNYAKITSATLKSFGLWVDTRCDWGNPADVYYSFKYAYVLSDYIV